MRRFSVAWAAIPAAILFSAGAIHCAAQQQDRGYWRAASNTAAGITGDITLSDARLTINFKTFPLASIRSLKPAEVASVFDVDVNTAGEGALYRLNVPGSLRLLHRNTLCGSDDTQWMATYLSDPKTLQVAFFSGDEAPAFTFDAISHTTRLCGIYTYVR